MTFVLLAVILFEGTGKPSSSELAVLYDQRVRQGSKSIDDQLLKRHYSYWMDVFKAPTVPEDTSGLFLFLTVCNLEKKYQWSDNLINHKSDLVRKIFSRNNWELAVIDYLDYTNQVSFTGKTDVEFLKGKVQILSRFKDHNKEWEALVLDRLGRTMYDKNSYDSALLYLEKGGELMQKNKLKLYHANNLTMQGVVWDAKEKFDKSAQFYDASLEVLGSLSQPPFGTLGANAYNIGLIYEDRFGNGLKGLPYYLKALEYDKQSGTAGLGVVSEDYAAIARCYLREGDILKAEKYALLSLDVAKQIQPSAGFEYAKSLLVTAEVYGYKMHLATALVKAYEALEIFEKIEKSYNYDLRRQKAMTYNLIGSLKIKNNEPIEAESNFLKAVAISQEISREVFLIQAYPGLIESAIQRSMWSQAREYWASWGVIIEQKFKAATYQQQLHRLKGLEISIKSKEFASNQSWEKRLQDFLNADSLISDIYLKGLFLQTRYMNHQNMENDQVINHLLKVQQALIDYLNFQYHVVNAAFQSPNLKALISESIQLGIKHQHWDTDDRIKLVLVNLLSLNKSIGSIPKRNFQNSTEESGASLIYQEKKLSERYAEVSFMIYAHEIGQKQVTKNQLVELTQEEIRLERDLLSIREQLQAQFSAYFYSYFVAPIGSLKEFQSKIGKEELWIETFIYEDKIFALYANRSEVYVREVKLDQSIKDRWLIRNPKDIRNGKVFESPQLEKFIGEKLPNFQRLIFVPDSWLALVPLEVFTYQQEPLLFTKEVVYDVSLLDRVRREKKSLSPYQLQWKGFAPYYENNSLVFAEQEIQRIHQLTKGKSFIGPLVTKDLFKEEASHSKIFNLAAHGYADVNNPGYNALIFGEELEEYLTVNEIYDWVIDADLGVLSACGSGVVNTKEGAGLLSLGRAFNFAGVPSLVIGLWEIPDKQSATIMEMFYENLLNGMSKSESLRQAKIRYLQITEDEFFKHPYFWAGLVLLGEDQQKSERSFFWIFLLPGIVIVGFLLRKFFQ
ncbi:hypothetical protein GCM10008106_03020 [Mongoliitalea lutea]|uniref:CHAT domain-containing protein n=2 Tax=Mongoliitalea lutea TaxID=849756 RepID=A0A8J3G481_9BACT|nr:hypothetical protein GCM10008106_03020 [Mongoliitalea lutea]